MLCCSQRSHGMVKGHFQVNVKVYMQDSLLTPNSATGYEKRWMVLLGNEIHIYTTKIPQREQGSAKPIQHYPLHPSISITVDNDFKMHIKCELWTIRAQATSNEERENWRIRILTIARAIVGPERDHPNSTFRQVFFFSSRV
ncbi:uncharacterized protein LOC129283949 [Lytechinus pictus]|uniref:uncharacterized protein LOC129283949 n=1 Tax=Lytechinus pictus TaxID=7653 RepID=UPI0030B9F29E